MTTKAPSDRILIRSLKFVLPMALAALLLAGWFFYDHRPSGSARTVLKTWEGFKYHFIFPDGRVLRPKDGDTVSEGQAYAMLRAVWLDDKEAFDRCYRWSRLHLSRADLEGDRLLAWLWKDGKVVDRGSASDADIDYALALIFAEVRWSGLGPKGLPGYGEEAKGVLADILRLETYRTASGRLYLSPWVLKPQDKPDSFPVNPSYYSPAHFRIFKKFTGDKRWNELLDTTYFVLNTISEKWGSETGIGLVPDWATVDQTDRFDIFPDRSDVFGWDAVRVPFRLALDREWFQSAQAESFLKRFSGFLDAEWKKRRAVYCVYSYGGEPWKNPYESPAFYSCYSAACRLSEPKLAELFLNKTRQTLARSEGFWVYGSREDYYVNCLAWYAEGFRSGSIRDLTADAK